MTNQQSYAQAPPRRRLDSEWKHGLPFAAFLWIETPPFAFGHGRDAGPPEDLAEHFKQLFYGPKFKLTTTNSKLQPGIKDSYGLLPFRALEDHCLPAAIQQRWEASVAASKSAEWRLWFGKLSPEKQKIVVQHFSKTTKDKFWAGLWLEYEEWSEPRRARHVAAAARAHVFLERERVKKQMEELEWAQRGAHIRLFGRPWERPLPHSPPIPPAECPKPLSAPITPAAIASLDVRLAPAYFRLPNHARRFASRILWGQSYEEAVAEQKANFNSWTREAKTRRVEGMPDYVVWDNEIVHEDDVARLTAKKEKKKKKKQRSSGKKGVRVDEVEGVVGALGAGCGYNDKRMRWNTRSWGGKSESGF